MKQQQEYGCQVHLIVLGSWDDTGAAGHVERAARRIGGPADYSVYRLRSDEDLARFTDDPPLVPFGGIFCVLADAESDWHAAWLVARLHSLENALVLCFSISGEHSATRDFVGAFRLRRSALPLVMEYLGVLMRHGLRQEGHIALDWNDVKTLLGHGGKAALFLASSSVHDRVPAMIHRRLLRWKVDYPCHLHVHVTADRGLLGRTLKATMAGIRSAVPDLCTMAVSLQYEGHKGMSVLVATHEVK